MFVKALKKLFWILSFTLIMQSALADSFLVKQIQVQGLQRVRESTVLSYIPVNIGQTITTEDTVSILKALYQTGFFLMYVWQDMGIP